MISNSNALIEDHGPLLSESLPDDSDTITSPDDHNNVVITEPPPTKKILINNEAGPSKIKTPKDQKCLNHLLLICTYPIHAHYRQILQLHLPQLSKRFS